MKIMMMMRKMMTMIKVNKLLFIQKKVSWLGFILLSSPCWDRYLWACIHEQKQRIFSTYNAINKKINQIVEQKQFKRCNEQKTRHLMDVMNLSCNLALNNGAFGFRSFIRAFVKLCIYMVHKIQFMCISIFCRYSHNTIIA